jgi:hypothetical protein
MKFLKFLQEEYFDSILFKNKIDRPIFLNPGRSEMKEEYLSYVKSSYLTSRNPAEIFIDPSKAEIRSAGGKDKEVRFIVDSRKKKFYVWHGFSVLHFDVIKHLKISGNYTIRGIGKIGPDGKIIPEVAESWGTSKAWPTKNKNWLSSFVNFEIFMLNWENVDEI